MNLPSAERIRQDCRLIRQTLLKLTLARFIMQGGVVVAGLLIWLFIGSWLLAYGKTVDYSFLHTLGRPTVEFLGRINPYLWWIVTGLWTLLAFTLLRNWLRTHIARGHAVPIQPQMLTELASCLCSDVRGVLRWTWGLQEEPFTVGDLRRSLGEIRSGRIAKIAMVREQAEALSELGRADHPPSAPATAGRRTRYSELHGELPGP